MKIAQIDWPLFWPALNQQDFASRNRWLGRWVFADDGAKLSMQSAPGESTSPKLDAAKFPNAMTAAERTPVTATNTAPCVLLGSTAAMELVGA